MCLSVVQPWSLPKNAVGCLEPGKVLGMLSVQSSRKNKPQRQKWKACPMFKPSSISLHCHHRHGAVCFWQKAWKRRQAWERRHTQKHAQVWGKRKCRTQTEWTAGNTCVQAWRKEKKGHRRRWVVWQQHGERYSRYMQREKETCTHAAIRHKMSPVCLPHTGSDIQMSRQMFCHACYHHVSCLVGMLQNAKCFHATKKRHTLTYATCMQGPCLVLKQKWHAMCMLKQTKIHIKCFHKGEM